MPAIWWRKMETAEKKKMLGKRGIIPENLPKAEDVKKLQRKLEGDEKKILKETKQNQKKN